jgi:hypothetical protein
MDIANVDQVDDHRTYRASLMLPGAVPGRG